MPVLCEQPTRQSIVTGGAGNFAGWTGEQRQTFLGFNPTGGVNQRVTFILRPPAKVGPPGAGAGLRYTARTPRRTTCVCPCSRP